MVADPPAAIVLAGSLPPALSAALLHEALAPLLRADVPLWLDASDDALTAGLALPASLVKPNVDELAACVGRPLADATELVGAGRELQARGVAEVAISRGADGVLWLTGDETLAATAPAVTVENTVCAGDTLVAGLMHGRLSGWADTETLAFAVALSADAVTRIGVGQSDTPVFERLRGAVAVHAVDIDASVE